MRGEIPSRRSLRPNSCGRAIAARGGAPQGGRRGRPPLAPPSPAGDAKLAQPRRRQDALVASLRRDRRCARRGRCAARRLAGAGLAPAAMAAPGGGEHCSALIEALLGECASTPRQYASAATGLASVACWVAAELPQIYANYRAGAADAMAPAFLAAWLVGDVLNVVGTILTDALPTMRYVAVLYTATTAVLAVQFLYYRYSARRARAGRAGAADGVLAEVAAESTPLLGESGRKPSMPLLMPGVEGPTAIPSVQRSLPHPSPAYMGSFRTLAVASPGRSLTLSHTVPSTRDGEIRADEAGGSDGADDPESGGGEGMDDGPRMLGSSRASATLRAAGAGLACVQLAVLATRATKGDGAPGAPLLRRALLTAASAQTRGGNSSSLVGEGLGWCMAAIYTGGRVPQIIQNFRRRSVESLSLAMFLFAIAANSTYVASILLDSVEWERVRPSLPWLVDAVACMVLDVVIWAQYTAYSSAGSKPEQ